MELLVGLDGLHCPEEVLYIINLDDWLESEHPCHIFVSLGKIYFITDHIVATI